MQKREHADDVDEPRGLQETDVFITEYLNKTTSFTAIIKQRFSDFQVFEIDEKGNVVHLTSLENNLVESKPEVEVITEPYQDVNIDDVPVKELSYPLCSEDQWKQLTLLMKRKKKEETIRIEVTSLDKTERTAIHNSISSRFKGALSSKTVEEAGKGKFIVIGTCKSADKRNLWTWPKDLPQYLHFVMYKENIDTINAVRTMCKILRISQNSVSYAGTKDRRGVTTQRMCIRRMCAKRVHALSHNRLWCGNFEHKEEPLKLGQLKGNRFVVALRNVESSNENVEETLKKLEELGFVNYYGLQRFGAYSQAPTYEIGKNLICNKWSEAINLILKPRQSEKQSDVQQACKIWAETGDAVAAVKSLRYDHSAEGIVLKTLSQQGNTAYVNALQKVPRNILLLYVHSFQSLVWNRVVSRRLREHGLKVLPGDLVYVDDVIDTVDITDVDDVEEDQTCSKSVRPISTDEVEKVSIYDVVYPLPGYSIKYPENEIAKWYQAILNEYEVADFNGKNKMFTASGDYRKMLVLPENVKWKTVFYDNPSADLIATDLQKLKNENTVENLETGSCRAVILEFSLPACTYATMALREITKTDTSSSHQASLSSTHLQNKKAKLSE